MKKPALLSRAGFWNLTILLGGLGQSVVRGNDVHDRLAFAAFGEQHAAIDQSEDRVILAETDIFACVVFRAALADDNVAGKDDFTAVTFYAKTTTC